MSTADILNKWKEILVTIAGILVVALQIINVILSNDIEHTMSQKSELMEQKAAGIQTLVERNRADLEALHNELHAHDQK